MPKNVVLLGVMAWSSHTSALADELHVPAQYPTIQAALDAAIPGDEIVLSPGTYRESIIAPQTADLTLRSTNPHDPTTVATTILSGDIDGDGSGDSRILEISGIPEDTSFTVDGLTFTDGYTDQHGGAIYFDSFEASMDVHRSKFVRNVSDGRGGAIATNFRTYTRITESLFQHNTAPEAGGAVLASGDLYQVYNCAFLGNRSGFGALSPCGAFFSFDREPVDIVGCIFVGNHSETNGAVVICGRSTRVANCTFSQNFAENAEGSAIGQWFTVDAFDRLLGSDVTVSNSIVEIQRTQLPFNSGIVVDDSISLPFWAGERTLIADPLFVRPPNNGGDGWGDDPATTDIDESQNDDFGDLRLLPGSPAIDIGDSSVSFVDIFDLDRDGDLTEAIPVDLDLNNRYTDDPMSPNTGLGPVGYLDLGAYEYAPQDCLADINNDGTLSPTDFTAWIAAYNAMLPAADQNQDGNITPTDFTAWINNYNAGC